MAHGDARDPKQLTSADEQFFFCSERIWDLSEKVLVMWQICTLSVDCFEFDWSTITNMNFE